MTGSKMVRLRKIYSPDLCLIDPKSLNHGTVGGRKDVHVLTHRVVMQESLVYFFYRALFDYMYLMAVFVARSKLLGRGCKPAVSLARPPGCPAGPLFVPR